MTIAVLGLKVGGQGFGSWSHFETWSVGPRSSIEDTILVVHITGCIAVTI